MSEWRALQWIVFFAVALGLGAGVFMIARLAVRQEEPRATPAPRDAG